MKESCITAEGVTNLTPTETYPSALELHEALQRLLHM